jgi:hypothetical protein
MSNYPFGLRGDPFAPPATLSAKEASRLIRRRIRACNGDGGLLFPIDACDAIHAAANGVPDAVLILAGRALAIAAADKARCVTPAHVKRAEEEGVHAPATAVAAVTPVAAEEPAIRGEPAAAEDEPAEAPAAETLRSEPEPRSGKQGRKSRSAAPPAQPAEAADEDEDQEAVAEMAAEVAAEAPGIESFDYADSDLPPFRPASVALPTRPSEDLPVEAREWVSRFIPGQVVPPPAAHSDAPRVARAAAEPEELDAVEAPAPAASSPPAPSTAKSSAKTAPAKKRTLIQAPDLDDIPAAPSPGRPAAVYTPAPVASRRGGARRHNSSRALVGVLGVVALLAIVLRYSTPGHLATPESENSRTARTSARAVERRVASPPQETVVPHESHESSSPPAGSAFYEANGVPSPAGGSAPLAGAESAPAAVEPVKHTTPSSRYALEVASFIFEERARQECDRLAAAGLRARVVTTLEFGSRVYRVVVGGYPHPAAAERAADSLLSNGVVLQARVVSGTPSRP